MQAAAFRMLQDKGMTMPSSSTASTSPSPLTIAKVVPTRFQVQMTTDHVIVNKIQLQACIDALRRAKAAADGAHHLCANASRAFAQEASVFGQCEDALAIYID